MTEASARVEFDSLEDDEIDKLVDQIEGEDIEDDTEDTASSSQGTAAKADDESQEGGDPADKSEDGESEPQAAGTQAGTPAPAPTQAAAAAAVDKPFQYKARGATHTAPGWTEKADGSVVVSREQTPELRRVLASEKELRETWTTERRARDRTIKALQTERTAKDVESDLVVGVFKNLRTMTPEERWEWAQNFDEQAPRLELEIQKAQIAREREALKAERAGPELSEEEQVERFQSTLKSEVDATFRRLAEHPSAKHLSREEMVSLYEKWQGKADRLVRRAQADDPATGVKKNDVIFDDEDILDDFKDRVTVRLNSAKTLTAAGRNAKLNADQASPPVPPTIRGTRPPRGDPKKKEAVLSGKKAFKEKFMSGELDDSDD